MIMGQGRHSKKPSMGVIKSVFMQSSIHLDVFHFKICCLRPSGMFDKTEQPSQPSCKYLQVFYSSKGHKWMLLNAIQIVYHTVCEFVYALKRGVQNKSVQRRYIMENQAFERLLHDCLYTENNGWNQTKISFYYRIPAP